MALIVGYAVPFFVAILLNELRHAKGYLRCPVNLPVMLPPTSALLLFAYFYDPTYGLFNDILHTLHLPTSQWVQSPGTTPPTMAMISVVIAATWMNMGGATLKRFFDSIPDDLLAAAAIDGASPLRTLRSVVLPISRPIIGVVSIFSLVAVWKDFLWPLLVEYGYNPSRETLNVGIWEASSTTPQNLVLAASAMAAVPTLIFFLIFQRNILAGLTAGIDAIWFTPWYPSPKSDAGYDVADYRSIDPAFGTLADADALIADGHAHGIKTIIDIVPNHCSDRHPWFQAALAAAPGSAERARFWFRPGHGPGGDRPPNNWRSIFGGPAWTRVTAPDGTPGEWYLHLFAPEQPDFNWASPPPGSAPLTSPPNRHPPYRGVTITVNREEIMPGARHCRHCYGDCPGICLMPGGEGRCIHQPAPKLTPGQRLALLRTRWFWHRVLRGPR